MLNPKKITFMKNIEKLIVSKPMKGNKNAEEFFFLLSLIKSKREKKSI